MLLTVLIPMIQTVLDPVISVIGKEEWTIGISEIEAGGLTQWHTG